MRLYELAKECGLSTRVLTEKCKALGIKVREPSSYMTILSEEDVQRLNLEKKPRRRCSRLAHAGTRAAVWGTMDLPPECAPITQALVDEGILTAPPASEGLVFDEKVTPKPLPMPSMEIFFMPFNPSGISGDIPEGE